MELSDEQLHAVSTAVAFPRTVCIAPPGSGKTRVLIAVYQSMVNSMKIVPSAAVLVTYTQQAAGELARRIEQAGLPAPGFVGTLHAFMLRVLRDYGHEIGFRKVAVCDSRTSRAVLERVANVVRFQGGPDQAKKAVENLSKTDTRAAMLYNAYHSELASEGLVDFEGILLFGEKVLMATMGVTGFEHLFVDEFQDVSERDASIYWRMRMQTRFVIGDPRQAIYEFRGGDPRQLMELTTNPEWKQCYLTLNFRSTPSVCALANSFIDKLPMKEHPIRPTIVGFTSPGIAIEEYDTPTDQLKGMMDFFDDCHHTDTKAIICRYNWQLQEAMDYMDANGIEYVTKSARRKPNGWDEVRALVAFLGSPDSEALAFSLAVLTMGGDRAKTLREEAITQGVSLRSLVWKGDIPSFEEYSQVFDSFGLGEEVREIVASIILEMPRNERTWEGLGAALADPEVLNGEGPKAGTKILMTTIHGAKGLEFDAVCAPYWNQDFFPGNRRRPEQKPEEFRLAYVAVTRAAKHIHVSYTKCGRPHPRSNELKALQRSEFLDFLEGSSGE